jgi:hypothetical protein
VSTNGVSPTPRQEAKSRTPCVVLPIVGVFLLMLCYVTFVVVRNVSPTAISDLEGRQATATVQTSNEIDAGATIAVELQAEATQTALTISPNEPQTTLSPTPSAVSPQPLPTATPRAGP